MFFPDTSHCPPQVYESSIAASNKVYSVKGAALEPLEEAWAQVPSHALLQEDQVWGRVLKRGEPWQ